MLNYKCYRIVTVILASLILLTATATAVKLTPQAVERLKAEGHLDHYIGRLHEAKINGLDQPAEVAPKPSLVTAAGDVDTLTLLVLCVQFTDNPYTAGDVSALPADFDSILFSRNGENLTGSMNDFYLENSYGTMYITGEVHGWYLMPHPYSYYTDGQGGIGDFPNNTQGLALDAIYAADTTGAGIDFSLFDTYGSVTGSDGEIDGLMLIHSGPGGEQTGSIYDIQSHKWNLGVFDVELDGILIDQFTVQPEELAGPGVISPIGVFCHEFGHILGLPDLYDIDYDPETSDGIGDWSLMATGSYNNSSRTPAHMDAWCKAKIGFVQPIEVSANMTGVEIPQVESEPVVYKLWKDGIYGLEYFLVENRQRVGFDSNIPGTGLLIYHVDDGTTYNNENVTHYHVAVEQADGAQQLEYGSGNEGDQGDPWPGITNKISFDDLSDPSSRSYGAAQTQVSVWNIFGNDSLMSANLDIEWSRPAYDLNMFTFSDENGNGVMESGETVEFYFLLQNFWMETSNATISLSANDPGITFSTPSVTYSSILGDGAGTGNVSDPIIFKIQDELIPTYDTFFVNIVSNGGMFDTTFAIERQVGNAQVLIVDDDRGSDYEQIFIEDLYTTRIPTDIWSQSSTPPQIILNSYNIVIWLTGDTSSNKINATDISALKNYLDNNGRLFLTGQGLAGELHLEDSTFLEDYLHARYSGWAFSPLMDGVDSSAIGDGLELRYVSWANQDWETSEHIIPVGGAEAEFVYGSSSNISALSYSGDYKVVFFDWGYEALDNTSSNFDRRDTVMARIMDFFSGITTEVAADIDRNTLPQNFELAQNYPNPFNPTTTIRYKLKNSGGAVISKTVLKVYNMLGREVRTLVDDIQKPGLYEVVWDGRNGAGKRVASGIYLYSLYRGSSKETKKMILLK